MHCNIGILRDDLACWPGMHSRTLSSVLAPPTTSPAITTNFAPLQWSDVPKLRDDMIPVMFMRGANMCMSAMHPCAAVLSTSSHLGTAARSPAGAKLSRSPPAAPEEALMESAVAASLTPEVEE